MPKAETDLFPLQFLAPTQRIERDSAACAAAPKGPRTIDIDILLFGTRLIRTPASKCRTRAWQERRFVLVPLADLAPGLCHPVTRRTIREMLDTLPGRDMVQPWRPMAL